MGILEHASFLPRKELTTPQVLRGGAGAEPNRIENKLWIEAHNNILATGKVDGERFSMVVGGLKYRDFLRLVRIEEKKKQLTVTIEDPQGKIVDRRMRPSGPA